jgi:hypothetical protein
MPNTDGGTVVPKMTLRIHHIRAYSIEFRHRSIMARLVPPSTFAESKNEPEVSSQFA